MYMSFKILNKEYSCKNDYVISIHLQKVHLLSQLFWVNVCNLYCFMVSAKEDVATLNVKK